MSSLFSDVSEALSFLSTKNLDYSSVGQMIANRTARLIGQSVKIGFSCPNARSVDDHQEMLVVFDSSGAEPHVADRRNLISTRSEQIIDIDFSVLDERHLLQLKPIALIVLERPISQKGRDELYLLVDDLLKRVVQRQRALIRREFINVKVRSSDLGSFLHKLLRDSTLLNLIGAETSSIFVAEPQSDLLRLRGSTGTKAGTTIGELFFAPDAKASHVRDTYDTRTPYFESSQQTRLQENQSDEVTQHGVWARACWPIQLQFRNNEEFLSKVQKACVGAMRISNRKIAGRTTRLPFSWLELATLEFTCESLFNIVFAFVDADAAGFRKEQAFHGTMAIIDGLAKNIDRIRHTLFEKREPDTITPRLFEVVPYRGQPRFSPEFIRHSLNTAYACARDLSFQVERANYEFSGDRNAVTQKLLTDVLIRAREVIPDICLAHSVSEGYKVTSTAELFRNPIFPPPVKGSSDALTSVFLNVFENSIKYRKRGQTIELRIAYEVTPEFVQVDVSDNGIGVTAGEEERIFLREYRSDRAVSHSPRGSGLGLTWCRTVLDAYQGTISAHRTDDGLKISVRLKRQL